MKDLKVGVGSRDHGLGLKCIQIDGEARERGKREKHNLFEPSANHAAQTRSRPTFVPARPKVCTSTSANRCVFPKKPTGSSRGLTCPNVSPKDTSLNSVKGQGALANFYSSTFISQLVEIGKKNKKDVNLGHETLPAKLGPMGVSGDSENRTRDLTHPKRA